MSTRMAASSLLLVASVASASTVAPLPAAHRVRCAPHICMAAGKKDAPAPRPPVALRCLDKQEVLDRMNAVPAFGVVNGAEQMVAETDKSGAATICRFYLEISEAQAAVAELRKANPNVAIGIAVTPLGTAFALSEWQETVDEEGTDGLLPGGSGDLFGSMTRADDDDRINGYEDDLEEEDDLDDTTLLGLDDEGPSAPSAAARSRAGKARSGAGAGTASRVTVRLQGDQEEVSAVEGLLDAAPVPPLLRRRNAREGPIPLFGSEALRFRLEPSGESGGFESVGDGAVVAGGDEDGEEAELLMPIFFRRADFSAAWAASGGKPEEMPAVQLTDLRTLAYQMRFDTTTDYRKMLLVAPEPAIQFVQQEQQREQEAAEAAAPNLSAADAQGLIFGGGGPSVS